MRFYRENKVNPGRLVPAAAPPDPDLHLALLRPARVREGVYPLYPASDLSFLWIVPNITDPVNAIWSGWLLLVVYVAEPARRRAAHPGHGQDAADHLHRPAVRVRPVHRQLPGRPAPLLGHDEPLDGRPGPRPAAAAAQAAGAAEAQLAHAREGRSGSGTRPTAKAAAPTGGGLGAATRPAAQEARPADPAMSDRGQSVPLGPNQVEGTGETVGEAKWAARASSRSSTRGSRRARSASRSSRRASAGLLGVGFTPARVIAELSGKPPAPKAKSKPRPPRVEEEPGYARRAAARAPRARLRRARHSGLGRDQHLRRRPDRRISGPDLALLIGKRGQTIDAIQHLANAMLRTGTPAPEGRRSTPPATAPGAARRSSAPPSRRPGVARRGTARCRSSRCRPSSESSSTCTSRSAAA